MELNMKKPITLGLSLAALLAGGAAYAAQGHGKADADGNGVVTRAEAQAGATARFARMDVNKDGKIDQADRQLRRETMRTRMFERLDTDHDGQLTKAEFTAASGQRGRGKRVAQNDDAGAGVARHGRGHGRRAGRMGMMGMARMADADRDGAITQAEFQTAALQRFDTMDANKDGQVTQAERAAVRAQMKARWQQGSGQHGAGQQQPAARQTQS
jgi:Ca2+-binding EF-hand superfamily protein